MAIELDPRPETIPNEAPQAHRRRPSRIWGVVMIAAVLAAVPLLGPGDPGDGSNEIAEAQRMSALAPAPAPDVSWDVAELRRFQGLAPGIDGSHEVAEAQRMLALAPTADTSHETAELRRMLALQP